MPASLAVIQRRVSYFAAQTKDFEMASFLYRHRTKPSHKISLDLHISLGLKSSGKRKVNEVH